MHPAVLIIEDELTLASNLHTYLTRLGFEVRCAETAESGIELLDAFRPEVVLLDYNLPGCDGLEALGRIRSADPQIRVVLITGCGTTELAVKAMKAGAADYLSKPLALAELRLLLERLVGQNQLEGTVDYFQRRQAQFSGLEKILGESAAMLALKRTVGRLLDAERQLIDGRAPAVLITGETGTGKGLVARALHFDGIRRSKPFVEINCGALPSTLVEAELFGYERGAFTDARQRKVGLGETANEGTLFLDEIGDTEPALQVKLLKLIEEQSVRRLGGLREQRVNVRVISATNRSLSEMVGTGQFRADLFYRLYTVELRVPALRERANDAVLLARHFLALNAVRYRKHGMRLTSDAEAAILQYPWPGNVRELRNAIEQAVLLASGNIIEPDDLPLARGARPVVAVPAGVSAANEADLNLDRIEQAAIQRALDIAQGNVTQASRLLGISRDTLRYRLEKHRAG